MLYVVVSLLGMLAGAVCVFLVLENKRKTMAEQGRQHAAQAERNRETLESIRTRQKELDRQAADLEVASSRFDAQAVSYKELQDENAILKRDLGNVDVNLRKASLDREQQRQAQETLDQRSTD